ncbi:uncharacterized protein PRCAT00002532001 [Priceomyces carsonii]|uniref:uncharacterized protein n=1 Tax=Priceomyces carsonii TaxID=28549 RepID=UPI002EDB2C9D|nr:unnamed protein product [Priceomyces carsonii]
MVLLFTEENFKKLSQELDVILADSTDAQKHPDSYASGVVSGVTNQHEVEILKALGYKNLESKEPMQTDSLFCIFSCTKAVVSTGLLQLWERGLLDLDAPAKNYLPRISKLGKLKGLNHDNTPLFEKPKVDITTRMLLTHTSGLGYTFFSDEYEKVDSAIGEPSFENFSEKSLDGSFLLFEPGTQWMYGMGIDWAGKVLEAITGKSLGEYLKDNILEPAHMDSSTFHVLDEKDKKRLVTLYSRTKDGLVPFRHQPPTDPSLDIGGHGLFSTVEDYLKFIRIWLNDGKTSEGVPIISEKTFKYAIQNHLPSDLHVKSLKSYKAELSKDIPTDPSLKPNDWTLCFALNGDDLPTGRPKGSLYWCGLSNLFYWIDLKNKIGGFYASQIYPLGDDSAATSYKVESTVYKYLE